MTRKYWGPTTQPNTPNHPLKPNKPLVNQLKVLEPSLGLDLIDFQSSLFLVSDFQSLIVSIGDYLGLFIGLYCLSLRDVSASLIDLGKKQDLNKNGQYLFFGG